MKKKLFVILLSVFAAAAVASLLLFSVRDTDEPQGEPPVVKVLEVTSAAEGSSYRVGAALPATDFSSLGQQLSDKIEQEWTAYSSMSEFDRLVSSKAWGIVGMQTDTWSECEQAMGFAVDNPLESLDWLNRTGYIGMESTDPLTPVKHVQILANTAQATDRKLSRINITAGYNIQNIKITLSAALISGKEMYTTGSACTGYATYKENTAATGTGIPVLTVITEESEINRYHNDYFNAYWVKDNVFYTLRVYGEGTVKETAPDVLDRILKAI